jgi:ankyrin repeat protein
VQAPTGNTPLHMAVLHGDAKMTSQMVAAIQDAGGNVDVQNSNGDTVRFQSPFMCLMNSNSHHNIHQTKHRSVGSLRRITLNGINTKVLLLT